MSKNSNPNITIDPAIAENLESIEQVLAQEELDHEKLLELVTLRDTLISDQLEKLDDTGKQQFSQDELVNNKLIQTKTKAYFAQTENQLAKLVHSRKAIKKYK